MISAISSVLSNAAINISRMQVGTADNEAHAMAVISISEPLSADLLAQVGAIEAVNQVAQIAL